MATSKRPFLIPVENEIRSLEAKLLLACVAAERGFPAIIGSRPQLHLKIAHLPRGIYLAKNVAPSSEQMFSILRKLGHEIVVWIEDALLHPPAAHFLETRVSERAFSQVSRVFAWGEENVELFRQCVAGHEAPVHVTGNPRGDMLRPDVRPYFEAEVELIRERFGSPILINTNFSKPNPYASTPKPKNLVAKSRKSSPASEYLAGLTAHRGLLFSHFQQLVPVLAKSFPSEVIVVRPHPVENPEPWSAIGAQHENVHVVLTGNAIPWLMACQALIHNASTTGVEAFILGVPALSYHPVRSEHFEFELADALGHRVFDVDELCEALRRILGGRLAACDTVEQWRRVDWHLASLRGRLASDRIVDVLEEDENARDGDTRPPPWQALRGWAHAQFRGASKTAGSWLLGSQAQADYERHRFPDLSAGELQSRIARFRRVLGRFDGLGVRQLSEGIFEIGA